MAIKPGKYIISIPGTFFIRGIPHVLGSSVEVRPGDRLDPVLEHLCELKGLQPFPAPGGVIAKAPAPKPAVAAAPPAEPQEEPPSRQEPSLDPPADLEPTPHRRKR